MEDLLRDSATGLMDCRLADMSLAAWEVHAWVVTLDPCAASLEWLASSLSPDERARADRFHFQRDKRRFIVRRGTLRALLGSYSGIDPNRVRFCYGRHGKPALSGASAAAIRFNVSHSGELAFLGFARSREIGVDLEMLRPIPEAARIAEHFFSPFERRELHAPPVADRSVGFLNCWTRKEAYLKGVGDGLARPLPEFDVSLTPAEPARLLRVVGDASEPSRWFLQSLTPVPGYLAAVAVAGDGWKLKRRLWSWAEKQVDPTTGRQDEAEHVMTTDEREHDAIYKVVVNDGGQ